MNFNTITISDLAKIISCYDKTSKGFQDFIAACDVESHSAIILFRIFWR